MALEIKLPGFMAATAEVKNRYIVSVEGRGKSGKTHFALTFPGPIAVLSLDIGLEGVVGKFTPSKDILVREFVLPEANQAEAAKKLWADFRKSLNDCLGHKQIKTIVIDTFTDAWEIIRYAKLDKLTGVMPVKYVEVNAEFRDMVKGFYKYDKNVVLLHKVKEEYRENVFTGKMLRAGYGEVEYLVQSNIKAYKTKEPKSKKENFVIELIDCRMNHELAGTQLVNDEACYETLEAYFQG